MKEKKIFEYDAIRFIATILVVIGHSAYTTMQTQYGGLVLNVNYGSVQKVILLLVRLIYSFHMPLFIFLGGALYKYGRKRGNWTSLKKLVIIKFKRLIIPFIGVSFVWLLPLKYISGYYQNSINPIRDMFLGQILFFDNCHLWYLVSLFWIFIIVWCVESFIPNKVAKCMVIVLAYIMGCLIPVNLFGVQRAFRYLVFFYCGMKYDEYREVLNNFGKKKKLSLYTVIVIIAVVVYGVYLFVLKNNEFFYGLVAFGGIGLVYIFVMFLKKISFNLEAFFPKTIVTNSFGIYLYSDPINYIVLSLIIKSELVHLYESNIFCIGVFLFRIFITTILAIMIQLLVTTMRKVKKREV